MGTEDEINTKPIIEDILKRGKRAGVPKCISKGIMEVYEIHSMDDLAPGKYGILEPVDTCEKSHQKRLIWLLSPACPAVVMDTVLDMAVGTMTGI